MSDQEATTPAHNATSNINPHSGKLISTHGPESGFLSRTQLMALLAKYGFANQNAWVAIILRESQGDPLAEVDTRGMSEEELHAYWGPRFAKIQLGQEYSVGLFQINVLANTHYDPAKLPDPDYSMLAAFHMSAGGKNFKPWGGPPT